MHIHGPEYDIAFGPDAASKWNFEVTSYDKLRANPIVRLDGDHDVLNS
jgi:hypothetical protein